MQSLKEPNTAQTQMLDIFIILVQSGRECFATFQLHWNSQKSEKRRGRKSKTSAIVHAS